MKKVIIIENLEDIRIFLKLTIGLQFKELIVEDYEEVPDISILNGSDLIITNEQFESEVSNIEKPKIIMLTLGKQRQSCSKCIVLEKPFRAKTLIEAVKQLLIL